MYTCLSHPSDHRLAHRPLPFHPFPQFILLTPSFLIFSLYSIGSAAAEHGSLRQLKGGNGNKFGHNPKTWQCKYNLEDPDIIDPIADGGLGLAWPAACGAANGGKEGQDTCQACCECNCGSSDDEAPTEETCEVLYDGDEDDDKTCEDHGDITPEENGSCNDKVVLDACELQCNPTTTAAPPTTGAN